MNKQIKVLMQVLGLSSLLFADAATAAVSSGRPVKEEADSNEAVLFKIHDIIPEKDSDGKVTHCNIGATFFNHTKMDIANASISLGWDDEVIGEAIDQEERAEKEQKRLNTRTARSRYSTAGFTTKDIKASLKLPPLKAGQQVSLKTKIATDRCFLLLNDMDVNVSNCGTASMNEKISRGGCSNLFRYISPKMPEYYVEFREISPAEQMAMEDNELDAVRKEMNAVFEGTMAAIKDIAADVPETQVTEQVDTETETD